VDDNYDDVSDDSLKPGTGARFTKLKNSLSRSGVARNPEALAASIGRKKYGAAKMQKMATAGRKHP
jgi:hypothetical protein